MGGGFFSLLSAIRHRLEITAMSGITSCAECLHLEAKENRLQCAYNGILKTLSGLGEELTPEKYNALRTLADQTGLRLEATKKEAQDHWRIHPKTSEF